MIDEDTKFALLGSHLVELQFANPKDWDTVSKWALFAHRAAATIDQSKLSVDDRAEILRLIDCTNLARYTAFPEDDHTELRKELRAKRLVEDVAKLRETVIAISYRQRAKRPAEPITVADYLAQHRAEKTRLLEAATRASAMQENGELRKLREEWNRLFSREAIKQAIGKSVAHDKDFKKLARAKDEAGL